MERRLDPRWPANLDCILTDLNDPQRCAHARVIDVSRSGIRVRAAVPFASGTVLKLNVADCSLFGEVIHAGQNLDTFEIGVEIVRVLIGDSDLARLLNTILAESDMPVAGIVRP